MEFSHRFVDATEKERVFIVGDIHGKLSLLKHTLDQVNFDIDNDLLIGVGDLIDRGPESAETLCFYSQHDWFLSVIGNHEWMLNKAFLVWDKIELNKEEQRYKPHWLRNGGDWAEDFSYSKLKDMADIIHSMPCVITCKVQSGKTIGISHAQPHSLDWKEMQNWRGDLMDNPRWIWGRTRIKGEPEGEISNVDMTFHGHTRSDDMLSVSNSHFLDTASVNDYNGGFILYEVNSGSTFKGLTQIDFCNIEETTQ
ncbi:diadenosine tetraphosphatase [Veronia nyctiphanis]|uniref:Diadenosine tetraphosphatase n=1 Tax=Veronia nyctiphanis TaxID=1278244 RepID=A0A4Q0YNM3_9GAMM|nr:metallophosphoesterase [Veronia nyctiphanis]RXJ72547.1 diadenosine tetraphosphatase [Veronia nyctiphanis]